MRICKIRVYANYIWNDKKKLISRYTGSWGKVKIPFCRHFDVVFEKTKIFEKISIFTLKIMIFLIFFLWQENRKSWKSQKNHDFSENRSKIEFLSSDRSKSSSFWKYRFWRSFWCIYHSYNSIFHLVCIFRSCRPDHPKTLKFRMECRRIGRMFKKFSWKIESVWK